MWNCFHKPVQLAPTMASWIDGPAMTWIRYYFLYYPGNEASWWWIDGMTHIPRIGETVHLPFAKLRVSNVGYHILPIPPLEDGNCISTTIHVSVELSTRGITDDDDSVMTQGLLQLGWKKIHSRPF